MISQLMLDQFTAAERERQARISRAWLAYHGQSPKPLKPTKSDPKGEDNVRLNFGKLIVNKGVSFLFGTDLPLEVDGAWESEPDTWLRECLDANRWMTTLHRLGINGGVCGQAFLKIVAREPYPRLVVLDPATVSVRWQADDFEEVVSYTIQWHGVDPRTAKPVAYRQVIEHEAPDAGRWLITDQVSRGDKGTWETTGESDWPFPWAPILHCQNLPCPNEFWGLADLEEDLLETNHALNFVVSNLNRILRINAHPKTWGAGFQGAQLSAGIEDTIILPSPQATLQNLEMVSDLSSSLAYYGRLKEALHELARIPEVATGRVEDLGQLSGLALQILYGPLVELTATKRLLYGELLEGLARRLLELGGFGGEHQIKPQWPAVLPSDPKGDADTALVHEQLGVSKDTLLTRLGFDPQDEAKKRRQEAKLAAEMGDRLLEAFDRGEEVEAGRGEGEEEG